MISSILDILFLYHLMIMTIQGENEFTLELDLSNFFFGTPESSYNNKDDTFLKTSKV